MKRRSFTSAQARVANSDAQPKRSRSILVLTSTLPRWADDPEPRFVLDLARSLCHKYRMVILAPQASGAASREVLDGVEVRRFRYAPHRRLERLAAPGAIMSNLRLNPLMALLVPGFFVGQLFALVRLLRREHFDAVHCHWLIPQGLTIRLCTAFVRTPPVLLTCHGTDVYALNAPWLRVVKKWVLSRADAITVVSQHIGNFLTAAFGEPIRDKCELIPMGVDLSCFGTRGRRPPRAEFHILFAGRLTEGKGIRYLLRALTDTRLTDPQIKLRIVGKGPLRMSLEAEVAELGLGSRVRFLGGLSHEVLANEMASASVLCLPSVGDLSGAREGLPTVLLEAAASSLPIIASDVGGCSEFITSGQTGWLVPPADVDALAEALVEAMRRPAYARRLAEAANAKVQNFAWPRVGERYASMFDRLFGQGEAS